MLDAGPLIAFFNAKDIDHLVCRSGFEQLLRAKTALITPVPIIFEVHKWFLQKIGSERSQIVLNTMKGVLRIELLTQQSITEIYALRESLPGWSGSLEDTTVLWFAQSHRCPIWTLNYRDFGTFKSLNFWNPA